MDKMKPGPKPVNALQLEFEAMQWACLFYGVRDGRVGMMYPAKRGPWREAGGGFAGLPGDMSYGIRQFFVQLPIFIAVQGAAQVLPLKLKAKELKAKGWVSWVIHRPTMPKPKVWERLKKARSVAEVRRAARGIGQLRSAFLSSTEWTQNPAGALLKHAKGFLAAKKLLTYPRSERPKSDDKRVVLLAKAMAGLTLGLAPITARKRLSHWSWPRDWAERVMKGIPVTERKGDRT